MCRLSSIFAIGLIAWIPTMGQNQSPHGEEKLQDCSACHISENWVDMANPLRFDHDTTRFALLGVHEQVGCMNCHKSLVFEDVQSNCSDCHQDVHSNTVGRECDRCHNENSWLVNIIPEIHEENGFPLTGSHSTLQCIECHEQEINLRFDRLGNDCANCHLDDFNTAQNPNHIQKGYSQDCIECHDPLAFGWDGQMYDHGFFPLVGGHNKVGCTECHGSGGFGDDTPDDCYACHSQDYYNATEPNHVALGYSIDCKECHDVQYGWYASALNHNELYFPITYGAHAQGNAWNECTECHIQPDNYAVFSCIDCHEHNKADMDREHQGEQGYRYASIACLDCHPRGESD
jgi:Zn finger protein HypA/HybF involved in hydrogenase expression/mRNA-degrading endonuclease YafQ of YafQ-DinJ toxin-antitoxin module